MRNVSNVSVLIGVNKFIEIGLLRPHIPKLHIKHEPRWAMSASSASSELADCLWVVTHVTPVNTRVPYAQRPERQVAFGHNLRKWRDAARAFENIDEEGVWERKFWGTASAVFNHMNDWNNSSRPLPYHAWGLSTGGLEVNMANLISLSLLTHSHRSDELRH